MNRRGKATFAALSTRLLPRDVIGRARALAVAQGVATSTTSPPDPSVPQTSPQRGTKPRKRKKLASPHGRRASQSLCFGRLWSGPCAHAS